MKTENSAVSKMPCLWNLRAISIGCLLLVLPACVKVEIPPDVLPPEQMASILVDIHLLEGRRSGDKVLYSENHLMEDYYKAIFEKHSITDEQYRRSHHFYTQYPDLFSKIYDQVIEDLQLLQVEITDPTAPARDDNF